MDNELAYAALKYILNTNEYKLFINDKFIKYTNQHPLDRDLRYTFSYDDKGIIKAVNLSGKIKLDNALKYTKLTLKNKDKLDLLNLKTLKNDGVYIIDNQLNIFTRDCIKFDLNEKDCQLLDLDYDVLIKFESKLQDFLLKYIDKLINELQKQNEKYIKEYINEVL